MNPKLSIGLFGVGLDTYWAQFPDLHKRLLGYQADALRFGPDVVGLDGFPGRTDTGAPYRFLSVGLGFSTGFRPSPESHW